MSTDSTFFTNEPGKRLIDRFSAILQGNTRFFDCLVGYFFISGFHRLWSSLNDTEKIRILIGIKTDRKVFNLMEISKGQQELDFASHAQVRERMPDEILTELEISEDSYRVEEGVLKFMEWMKSGKLEIRAYPAENLHAKLYIMTFGGPIDNGRVITGSSNFTGPGLRDNLEFNVELKNSSDHRFALDKFNELWDQSVDVTEDYVMTIRHKSPYAEFTPHELYLKFLYEYFRWELSLPDEIDDMYLPPKFKKLKYQEEAVLNAKKILDEYGGVFLSDVVGLGKTYMSALLARHLNEPCLIVAPPHLLSEHNPGSWPNVFHEFGVRGYLPWSLGRLEALVKRRDLSKYRTVFVDESHRFRNEDAQGYELLTRICRGKRVVLVSATPLNNSPQDILSQIKLFQPGKNSTIPNVRNLEMFFGGLRKKLDGLDRQTDRDEYLKTVQENAHLTRENVLKYLMIRRTRSEIEKYYGDDLKEQGFHFPEVVDPEPLFYQFNKTEAEVFDETTRILTHELQYSRYIPLTYYTGESIEQEVQSQRNLAKFMKILMVKRLESSFVAFLSTLGRFIRTYERVIEQFHKGQVFISKDYIGKVFEYLETDNQEALKKLLDEDKAQRYSADSFRPEFIVDLESDLQSLKSLQQHWEKVERDPKWESFREILTQKPLLKNNKVIIFTESKETAEYLADRIQEKVESKVLLFTGQSHKGIREKVILNFDARAYKPEDDFRILVATEVLAEGVNLHRSNVVINYDIPWNPTRLIQRVGRVNRVDTDFERIYTFNFFPTDEGNDLIKLREAAESKIHAFIQMLGADAKLLTESEEIVSHDLFAKWNSKETITGEDEEETELKYLAEIRDVRDENPELFERIKRLPKKARSTRSEIDSISVAKTPGLLSYLRRGQLDKFFLTTSDKKTKELDFMTAAGILKPVDSDEKRITIPKKFYDLLDCNKEEFVKATTAEEDPSAPSYKGTHNENYIFKRLKDKAICRCPQYTEDDEEFVSDILKQLENGSIPKATSKKVAGTLKKELEPLKVLAILRKHISPDTSHIIQSSQSMHSRSPREVILSSYLEQKK